MKRRVAEKPDQPLLGGTRFPVTLRCVLTCLPCPSLHPRLWEVRLVSGPSYCTRPGCHREIALSHFPVCFKILTLWKDCKKLLGNPHTFYLDSPIFNILPHFLCLVFFLKHLRIGYTSHTSLLPNISVRVLLDGILSHITTVQITNSGNVTLMLYFSLKVPVSTSVSLAALFPIAK